MACYVGACVGITPGYTLGERRKLAQRFSNGEVYYVSGTDDHQDGAE